MRSAKNNCAPPLSPLGTLHPTNRSNRTMTLGLSLLKKLKLRVIAFLSVGLWVTMVFWGSMAVTMEYMQQLAFMSFQGAQPSLQEDYPVRRRTQLPLVELVESYKEDRNETCDGDLIFVHDTVIPETLDLSLGNRKIPRIVHLSSKSRCNDPIFARNMDNWRLKGHSLFLHDDEAIQRLFDRDWPEFPGLKTVLHCLPNRGAIMVDVWRILALWEYGGIYADIDTAPVPEKFNESTLTDDDDAFFVMELLGTPSQWFMAASPRHPMMYFTMQTIIRNVLMAGNLKDFKTVFTTGPGAVAWGFGHFVNWNRDIVSKREMTRDGVFFGGRTQAGFYVGAENRTVRIVGEKENESEYITRIIPEVRNNNFKNKVYQKTGMTHLIAMNLTSDEKGMSCLELLHHLEHEEYKKATGTSLFVKPVAQQSASVNRQASTVPESAVSLPKFSMPKFSLPDFSTQTNPTGNNVSPTESVIPRRLIFVYVSVKEDCAHCKQIHHVLRGEVHPGLARMINQTIAEYKSVWTDSDVEISYLGNNECYQAVKAAEPSLLDHYLKEQDGSLKSDVCRTAYLYLHGGYYFDNDMETLEPFVPPPRVTFASATTEDEEDLANTFVATTPGNPVLERALAMMMDHYQGKHLRTSKHYVNLGPATLKDAMHVTLNQDPSFVEQTTLLHELSLEKHKKLYPEIPRVHRRPMCAMVLHWHETQKVYFRSRGDRTPKCS